MDEVQETKSRNTAILGAINKRREEDPLIGAKIGSDELLDRLLEALKKKRGVHIESLLSMLGALGGYACHIAIREELVNTGKIKENQAFIIVTGKDEKKYYFGDLINRPLIQDRFSFWSLVAGEAKHRGAASLPDINLIFTRVSKSVGGETFGIPDIPENHKPSALPFQYLKALWPQVDKLISRFCQSSVEKPILIGLAAQKAMEMAKDILPPETAVLILMENAVPMSKIGPEWFE